MHSKVGVAKGIVVLCLSIWCSVIVGFAAGEDEWTEAKKINSAAGGTWEEWCNQWEQWNGSPVQMALTPGENESEINFSWYSMENDLDSKIRIGDNEQLKDAIELVVTTKKATQGFYYNQAVVTNLNRNKTYFYSYTVEGQWTKSYLIHIKNPTHFQFVFVGDPQIGSSYNNIAEGENEKLGQERAVCNDSFNWNSTLQAAYKHAKAVSFVVTAGDQIQSGNLQASEADYRTFQDNEAEYAGYLAPKLLRSIPVATTIGNHDCLSSNYSYHFNNPNRDTGYGATYAGADYYFTYGDSIFLVLNTNNSDVEEHERFISEALSSNKNVGWRIVAMHHDIFGSGEHSNDEDIISLRTALLPILRKYDINLVLTGHDHTYARAFIPDDDTKYDMDAVETGSFTNSTSVVNQYLETNRGFRYSSKLISMMVMNAKNIPIYMNHYAIMEQEREQMIQFYKEVCDNVVQYNSHRGILFITANSSTGSKYYKLIENQQDYVEARSQENQSSYTIIDITKERIQLNTFFTESGKKVDKTIVITK